MNQIPEENRAGLRLLGKKALITGGSSGIGLATAKLFVDHGARVVITGRDAARLARAESELGQNAAAVRSDAGNIGDIESLVEKADELLGTIDVLVINAAIAKSVPFEQVTESHFDDMLALNFKGVFFLIQKALPLLRENASIIFTTSIANRKGSPNFSVYGACKAAQRSLVKTLALELIGRGIRVNAISPGPIATPMFGKLGRSQETELAVKAEIERRSPIKRFGSPTEIAKVALFLASDESSYLVGEEIIVDGGMSLL